MLWVLSAVQSGEARNLVNSKFSNEKIVLLHKHKKSDKAGRILISNSAFCEEQLLDFFQRDAFEGVRCIYLQNEAGGGFLCLLPRRGLSVWCCSDQWKLALLCVPTRCRNAFIHLELALRYYASFSV